MESTRFGFKTGVLGHGQPFTSGAAQGLRGAVAADDAVTTLLRTALQDVGVGIDETYGDGLELRVHPALPRSSLTSSAIRFITSRTIRSLALGSLSAMSSVRAVRPCSFRVRRMPSWRR